MISRILPALLIILFLNFFNIYQVDNKSFFQGYESIFPSLITGIQIAIGLTGIISIFYLGKTHDYKREFLKYELEYLFAMLKTKKSIESILGENENKVASEIIRSFELDFGNRRESYFKMPKQIIQLALLTILYFVIALTSFIFSRELSNLSLISLGLASLISGIFNLLRLWQVYENTLSELDEGFKIIFASLSLTKHIDENKESFKNNFKIIMDLIKTYVKMEEVKG